MPTLSSQYAYLTTAAGVRVEPTDVSVTLDETFSPYCQATVVVPKGAIDPTDIDPRQGDRLKLRLQQDFGDLIYNSEITADFGGDVSNITAGISPMKPTTFTRRYTKPWNIFEPALPLSTVTSAYGGLVSALTAASLATVWRMSDFLHGSGVFNPAPSTIFDGDLVVREVTEDYIAQTVTISLTSDETLLQDLPNDGMIVTPVYSLRELINRFLLVLGTSLQPGTANSTYTGGYTPVIDPENVQSVWDFLIEQVQAAKFVFYCDEQRRWYLTTSTTTAGTIELKDDDNITAFTRTISRNEKWYNQAVIWYKKPNGTYGVDKYYSPLPAGQPDRGLSKYGGEIFEPIPGAAQSIVERSLTRGETYTVEAINNFDARPRSTLTTDVTGIPVMSGVIQSVTFALPSARMSIELRDLEEV